MGLEQRIVEKAWQERIDNECERKTLIFEEAAEGTEVKAQIMLNEKRK